MWTAPSRKNILLYFVPGMMRVKYGFGLGLLLLLGWCTALGQNRIGIEAGEGWTYLPNGTYTPGHYKFATDPELTFTASYLRRLNKNIYVGGRLMFQQYAFTYNYDVIDSNARQYGGAITTKASYFFVAPTLNISLDNRQFFHVYVSLAYGLLHRGSQVNHTYYYVNNTVYNDNGFRTDDAISQNISRIDFGLCQHIPLDDNWYITLTENYALTQGAITQLQYPINPPLNTANQVSAISPRYFTITAGISRKFIYTGWKARFVDED
jgi:hypothetical protein